MQNGRRTSKNSEILWTLYGLFKRLILQTHKNQGLFGKGLNECYDIVCGKRKI